MPVHDFKIQNVTCSFLLGEKLTHLSEIPHYLMHRWKLVEGKVTLSCFVEHKDTAPSFTLWTAAG